MSAQLVRAQLAAFALLLAAIVIVSVAPIVVTGLMGKVVPDSLIAMSDKTVIGLVGVLGTLVGVMWQSRQKDGETVTIDQPPGKPVPVETAP